MNLSFSISYDAFVKTLQIRILLLDDPINNSGSESDGTQQRRLGGQGHGARAIEDEKLQFNQLHSIVFQIIISGRPTNPCLEKATNDRGELITTDQNDGHVLEAAPTHGP